MMFQSFTQTFILLLAVCESFNIHQMNHNSRYTTRGSKSVNVFNGIIQQRIVNVELSMSSTAVMNKEYDAQAITVLEGLEPVRKRPGMYIGSTGQRGLHHLVFEVIDNSVDEALAGHCTEISVTLGVDGTIEVIMDNSDADHDGCDTLFQKADYDVHHINKFPIGRG
jgi:hypothetical protein